METNEKEYTYTFTADERVCIIDALLIMRADDGTTDEGLRLCEQVLDKI